MRARGGGDDGSVEKKVEGALCGEEHGWYMWVCITARVVGYVHKTDDREISSLYRSEKDIVEDDGAMEPTDVARV